MVRLEVFLDSEENKVLGHLKTDLELKSKALVVKWLINEYQKNKGSVGNNE